MSTPIQMTPPQASRKAVPVAQKEDAMLLQKEMINRNYLELATAHQHGALGLTTVHQRLEGMGRDDRHAPA